MAKSDKRENHEPETETENPEKEQNPQIFEDEPQADSIAQSIDAIGATLAQQMPEVQEHAINEEKTKQDAKQEQYSGITDRFGTPFNASIHKTTRDGEPTLTKQGNCILKPAGKGEPKKSAGGASVIGGRTAPAQNPEVHAAKVQARATGAMAANLLLTLGIVAGGEEWKPIKDDASGLDEKQMLESAFADYFEATGKTDLPPSMALAVAIGAYSLPRFTMPKTQTRLGKLKSWIVKKIADRKLKKHGLKTESNEKREKATAKSEG